MSFWVKLEKIFSKVEQKGFVIANKAHYYTINVLLCSFGYGVYTFFRDYNEFFIDARVILFLINFYKLVTA